MDLSPYLIHLGVLYVSFSLIFLIYRHKSSPKHQHAPKLPPGGKGWPLVGETLAFVIAGRKGNPQKFIDDRMKKYSADVFRTSLFGEDMAVFCGSSGNKFLFFGQNKYVTSWWPRSLKNALMEPSAAEKKAMLLQAQAQAQAQAQQVVETNVEESGEEGKSREAQQQEQANKLRSFLPEFLKPESLQHYVPIMDSMSREHLEEDWSGEKDVKVFPLAKKYTFALACRLFMSIENPQDVAKFAEPFALVTAGLFSVPFNFPGTTFHRAIAGGRRIREELVGIVRKRKMELVVDEDKAPLDLLTRMLQAAGKDMNETDIANKIIGFFIASHDTASTAITFIIKYLADYPHVYESVLKEQREIAESKGAGELLNWEDIKKMKYSWNVACEVMRLAPPAQGAFREAITDFTYAGYTIPKGWKAYWTVHTAHKDPKYFPDPEKFDPSRFEGSGPAPFTFIPFGGGPRMCPGKEYARLEILVCMHNVVTRFKLQTIDPNEKIIFNPSPIPCNGLPIRLLPH